MVGGRAAHEARMEFFEEHPILAISMTLFLFIAAMGGYYLFITSDFDADMREAARRGREQDRQHRERLSWAQRFKKNFLGARVAYQEQEAEKELLDQTTAHINYAEDERIEIPGVSIPESTNKKTL